MSPVTRPLFVENAKCIGLDIDAFSETCTTYFFAVSTWFQLSDIDVASEPVTVRLVGAAQRKAGAPPEGPEARRSATELRSPVVTHAYPSRPGHSVALTSR